MKFHDCDLCRSRSITLRTFHTNLKWPLTLPQLSYPIDGMHQYIQCNEGFNLVPLLDGGYGTLPPNVVCVYVYVCRCVYMCHVHWSLCKLAFFQFRKLWLMARSCDLPLLSCSGIKPPIFKAWTPLQPMHLVIHSTVLIIMYYMFYWFKYRLLVCTYKPMKNTQFILENANECIICNVCKCKLRKTV